MTLSAFISVMPLRKLIKAVSLSSLILAAPLSSFILVVSLFSLICDYVLGVTEWLRQIEYKHWGRVVTRQIQQHILILIYF